MQTHELKTWPRHFRDILAGVKTFEFRNNDRGFIAGDILHLRECHSGTCEYTGRELSVDVLHTMHGIDAPYLSSIHRDFIVMSIAIRPDQGDERE